MTAADGVRELGWAARRLVKARGFTAASVVTLGLGVAATAAIFTLVDAVLLRPLPYPEPDRLVTLHHTMTDEGSVGMEWPLTVHTFLFVQNSTRSLDAVGGYRGPAAFTVTGEAAAERVDGVMATAGLLDVLGARTVVGRRFNEEEDRPGGQPVVVLGHGFWQRRFGRDPAVVGRSITVNGERRVIIGVMTSDVQLPTQDVDLWIPEAMDATARPSDEFRISVIGRLTPGADVASAQADLDALTGRLPEVASFFSIYLEQFGLRTHVRPLRDAVVGDIERALWILLGAVGIVMLVAVANVANLFLVRAEGRRIEVAVRSALGARRGHLLVHFLAESLIVSGAAAVLGLLLAAAGVGVLVGLAPPAIPRLEELGLGGPAVAVAVLLCLTLALILGAYPYLRFGRGGSRGLAQRGVRGAGDRREATTRDVLVAAQVALALVLLSGAALMFRSFQSLRSVDMGFEAGGILVAGVALPASTYASDDAVVGFLDRLKERMRAVPGVSAIAVGPSPLSTGGCSGVYVEGVVLAEGTFPPCAANARVGNRYFELLGLPVRAGRTFTAADIADGAAVAIVSEGLARRLWPGEDPVGKGVRLAPRSGPPWYRVIGVVGDVRGEGPDAPPTDKLYFPPVLAHDYDTWGRLSETTILTAAESGSGASLAPALRAAVAEIDRDVPVTVEGSLEDALARATVRTTFTMFLLATAACTALALGLVGLYGVAAYRAGTRRAEFGIRMAMGARAADVRSMVLGHSLRVVLAGTGVGLVVAALGTRLLGSLLYGVEPGDPWMLLVAAVALLVTALAATWIPAQRATRVDPAATLRNE